MAGRPTTGDARARVAVISDTHLPRGDRVLPAELLGEVMAADVTLHAGDVVAAPVWAELEGYGRLIGVRGNGDDHDLWRRLPQTRTFELAGVRIGMIHDAGRADGRPARLAGLFRGCDVVVFGHSHVPLIEWHGGQLLLNPGSAVDRRRQPTCTMVRLSIGPGGIDPQLLPLPTARRGGSSTAA